MPKRKHPEPLPEDQSRRFQELAKLSEADETGKKFEKAFLNVARSRATPKSKPKKSSAKK